MRVLLNWLLIVLGCSAISAFASSSDCIPLEDLRFDVALMVKTAALEHCEAGYNEPYTNDNFTFQNYCAPVEPASITLFMSKALSSELNAKYGTNFSPRYFTYTKGLYVVFQDVVDLAMEGLHSLVCIED